nr:hypothetical protein GCM10025732_10780 [Glycomyces mayteni]
MLARSYCSATSEAARWKSFMASSPGFPAQRRAQARAAARREKLARDASSGARAARRGRGEEAGLGAAGVGGAEPEGGADHGEEQGREERGVEGEPERGEVEGDAEDGGAVPEGVESHAAQEHPDDPGGLLALAAGEAGGAAEADRGEAGHEGWANMVARPRTATRMVTWAMPAASPRDAP